ncbi:hypothetical protein [Microbacterium sp. LWH10-1.2]|uniref:hypothetical protein n=1 Tax=Microbacterium sp. LWH10-1.2 TaxID=3135255 RepID=UPI003139FD6A
MTTSRVASDLAQIMVPIGVVGAVLATVCAIVAAVAITRGASGLSGGAVGLWIPSAMISSIAGFASQWMPLLASVAALVGLLVIGGVVRAIMNASGAEWPTRTEKAEAAAAAPAVVAPASVAPATSTIPTLTRPNPVRAA